MNEYDKQAQDFATKYKVSMTAEYLGHFPRLGEYAVAQFRITLHREGKKDYTFEYSDSLQDSWKYFDENGRKQTTKTQGLPPKLRQADRPTKGGEQPKGRYTLYPVIPKPSLYDVLTCVTKSDPGTFEDFCSEYGYDTDSRKALEVYFAVQKDWLACNNMFHDCLDELQEIN
jgi:hypothetical protein